MPRKKLEIKELSLVVIKRDGRNSVWVIERKIKLYRRNQQPKINSLEIKRKNE